jgi:CCR4-NOT transcription complex subunit 3
VLLPQQMERFKLCEKEMKTKAYSKEGLALNKTDPQEKAKAETRKWLGDVLDRLGAQIDAYEAEVEGLQAKKRLPVQQERLEHLERMLARHRHHQSRLEVVLRLLDNASLEPDTVNPLRDDVEYYVESHEVRRSCRHTEIEREGSACMRV